MEGSVVGIGVGKVLVRGVGQKINVLIERISCYNLGMKRMRNYQGGDQKKMRENKVVHIVVIDLGVIIMLVVEWLLQY